MPKGKKDAGKGAKGKGKGKDDKKDKPKKEYKHEHLAPDQIAAIKEVFDKYDKQEIDAIPSGDLITVLRLLQMTPTGPEIEEIRKGLYAETDNTVIEFKEFMDIYHGFSQKIIKEEQVREAFKVLDKDMRGEISVETLKQFLTSTGDVLGEDEFEALVQEADIEGTGMINYEEFVTIMSIE